MLSETVFVFCFAPFFAWFGPGQKYWSGRDQYWVFFAFYVSTLYCLILLFSYCLGFLGLVAWDRGFFIFNVGSFVLVISLIGRLILFEIGKWSWGFWRSGCIISLGIQVWTFSGQSTYTLHAFQFFILMLNWAITWMLFDIYDWLVRSFVRRFRCWMILFSEHSINVCLRHTSYVLAA